MVAVHDQHTERRQHFRINDTLSIQYQPIDDATADSVGEELISHGIGPNNEEKAQLRILQTAFSHIHDQINHHDRDIARALRILNDKITILSQVVYRQDYDTSDDIDLDVNLSGGGLAFLTPQVFEARSPLKVQLSLPSSGVVIQALAKVISCQPHESEHNNEAYYLRLAFTHMHEQDRDLLIKHILLRQAEQLRAGNNQLN